jgi:hypothetical protein
MKTVLCSQVLMFIYIMLIVSSKFQDCGKSYVYTIFNFINKIIFVPARF